MDDFRSQSYGGELVREFFNAIFEGARQHAFNIDGESPDRKSSASLNQVAYAMVLVDCPTAMPLRVSQRIEVVRFALSEPAENQDSFLQYFLHLPLALLQHFQIIHGFDKLTAQIADRSFKARTRHPDLRQIEHDFDA